MKVYIWVRPDRPLPEYNGPITEEDIEAFLNQNGHSGDNRKAIIKNGAIFIVPVKMLSLTEKGPKFSLEFAPGESPRPAPDPYYQDIINEQDRLIGELTRKCNFLEDTERRRQEAISQRKKEAGYPNLESFDKVWARTLELANMYIKGVGRSPDTKVADV